MGGRRDLLRLTGLEENLAEGGERHYSISVALSPQPLSRPHIGYDDDYRGSLKRMVNS